MKISKMLIVKCADNLLLKHGRFTQFEVHKAIEKLLNRKLDKYEKARITQVVRRTYVLVHIEIDSRTKRRILEFE